MLEIIGWMVLGGLILEGLKGVVTLWRLYKDLRGSRVIAIHFSSKDWNYDSEEYY